MLCESLLRLCGAKGCLMLSVDAAGFVEPWQMYSQTCVCVCV